MTSINERIKKLLALGRNSGATEAEAETAMGMAAALMLKHGIDEDSLVERKVGAEAGVRLDKFYEDWHYECAQAAATLYTSRALKYRNSGVSFVGRKDNIEACAEMTDYLVGEVERLYKVCLPKGMSKIDRANFRKTFKFACARRLFLRAVLIIDELKKGKGVASVGSTALVVVESIAAQLREAEEFMMGSMNVKIRMERSKAAGLGTNAGRQAGDTVKLQRAL
jgi:hypothetical protein